MDFKNRHYIVETIFEERLNGTERTCYVVSDHVESEEELKELHDKYTAEGYEGIMVRNYDGTYKFNNRSADLQKYKESMDEEFPIVDVEQDKDGFGVFVCDSCASDMNGDFIFFNCTLKGTHKERKEVWDNRETYIGKHLKVKFQAYTVDGVPQFPVGLGVRENGD